MLEDCGTRIEILYMGRQKDQIQQWQSQKEGRGNGRKSWCSDELSGKTEEMREEEKNAWLICLAKWCSPCP